MKRTPIKDVKEGGVKVCGWADEIRDIGKIVFVILRDNTGKIQVTAKEGETDALIIEAIRSMHKESALAVEGSAIKGIAKTGFEITPSKLAVLSKSDPLPIDLSPKIYAETSLDKRLDARTVDLRVPRNQAVFKLQAHLLRNMQKYLDKQGFIQVFTPCLMGVASESGAEVFEVKYFEQKAFLRQDPQLHRQLTIAGGFEKIYDVGPSWRAEPSHTVRHLTEHRTVAVETAYIEDEFDIMKLEQAMIINTFKSVKKECAEELATLGVELNVPRKFPVLEFPKIYKILKEVGYPTEEGKAYSNEAEKALGGYVAEKYKSEFFFVNRFPFAEKPFYVMKYNDKWARSTDLIFRGIEMSSGGQREHRYDVIMSQAKDKGMPPQSVEWFAKHFRYGVPPHGGFALGLERLTMQIAGLQNVREAVLFPRDTERLTP